MTEEKRVINFKDLFNQDGTPKEGASLRKLVKTENFITNKRISAALSNYAISKNKKLRNKKRRNRRRYVNTR